MPLLPSGIRSRSSLSQQLSRRERYEWRSSSPLGVSVGVWVTVLQSLVLRPTALATVVRISLHPHCPWLHTHSFGLNVLMVLLQKPQISLVALQIQPFPKTLGLSILRSHNIDQVVQCFLNWTSHSITTVRSLTAIIHLG